MKVITFTAGGGRLKAEFEFIGLIVASYAFTLWEAGSNERKMYEKGNNKNPQDDSYLLPEPADVNHERLIQLRTEFVGLDPAANKAFKIIAHVYQGDMLLGSSEETGEVTGNAQTSLIFIQLKK